VARTLGRAQLGELRPAGGWPGTGRDRGLCACERRPRRHRHRGAATRFRRAQIGQRQRRRTRARTLHRRRDRLANSGMKLRLFLISSGQRRQFKCILYFACAPSGLKHNALRYLKFQCDRTPASACQNPSNRIAVDLVSSA